MTEEEADNALRQAIIDHAEAFGLCSDGEMLNQYGVIAHWQRVETNGKSTYTTHFHTKEVPNHIAVGLFEVGANLAMAESEESE